MSDDLQEVSRSSLRISLDNDPVTRFESSSLNEIMSVRLVRAPATARVRLHLGFFRLSIMDKSEAFSFNWEKRESIL
jgi:hypothetical protein